jgi:NodT family efflux transporter outer membrane factor (OMF) lipoprotein
MRRKRISSHRTLLAALLLTGCAAGPNYHRPPPDAPAAYAGQPAGLAPVAAVDEDLALWWHLLADPELDTLVERAIRGNLDLHVALMRLQQARTYEALLLGRALPAVEASGGAGRGTGSDLTRGRAPSRLESADTLAGLSHINEIGGFDAVWELDFFGKYRREIEAARAGTQAAAAARSAVITSVVADVVRAYVSLRGLQMRSALLHQADTVLRESLRVVSIRYERGITNELDVTLAARELAALQAQIAPVEAQAMAAQYTLAVLLGEYPEDLVGELAEAAPLPSLPGPAQPGLPVELLRRRPDIQQAERELASATARIGVATANLLPQISLVGAIGEQGQGWGTSPVVHKHIWSFGPAALWPLLDFGTLDAQVDIADLEAKARLDRYRSVILSAVQEVDSALAGYAAERDRLAHLGEGVQAAERAVELANARYDRGLTDFLNVVDAERQLYELEDQYVTAQVAEAEQFVRLYKGLGGGWEHYQDVPAVRRPQPAIVAAFRRVLSNSSP